MKRLVYLPAVIAVLMILITGVGVYWISKAEVVQSRRESVAVVAQGIAVALSAQIELLNRTLDKMAQDPDVLAAVSQADPVLLNTVASKLERHFPDVLKIRVLLPGSSALDDKSEPRMGYADIDMVRETFTNHPLPSIQGDKGSDRHLAMTRRIMQDDKVIGVILASLNYDFISKSVQAAGGKNGYIQLKQGSLALGAAGKKNAKLSETDQVKVANTDWEIDYQYGTDISLGNLAMIGSMIIIPGLITVLVGFVEYRKFSELLANDLRTILEAAKDMIERRVPGSYPVNLSEMQIIISKMLQYKRASYRSRAGDNEDFDLNLMITDDKDFDLNNFL